MSPVLLDTSGLIAVINADDQWHVAAEEVWRKLIASQIPLITTSLVLIEIGDGLARVQQRDLAVRLYDRLRASTRVQVIQTTSDDETRAWELFRQRRDKEWGMTDCVSILIARDRGVNDVFSSDHHFEQASLKILLKS